MEEKPEGNRRKKIILTIIFAVFVISGISIQFPNLVHDFHAKRFVNKWAGIFTNCKSFPCVCKTSGMKPEFFYTRTFDNGEWVIAINADNCKGGKGYNASVFYGSDGALYYQIGHQYCGQAAFMDELNKINAGELTLFYDRLPYELHQWKG